MDFKKIFIIYFVGNGKRNGNIMQYYKCGKLNKIRRANIWIFKRKLAKKCEISRLFFKLYSKISLFNLIGIHIENLYESNKHLQKSL